MRVSTWAGATAGAALVYYFDDLRGAERRRRLFEGVTRLGKEIRRRRLARRGRGLQELDLTLNGGLTGETSFDWPLSVVTIDIDKALD